MKLDILVLASHPDDAELGCGGTMLKHVKEGRRVGIVDLTAGELGTRGTPEIRQKEASEASGILGLTVRENLGLPDGFFRNDREHQLKVIQAIRTYQPEIVLAGAVQDRHPDHGRSADLAFETCFLSGLAKIETKDAQGKPQRAWRPSLLYHYIQSQFLDPDFVIDITVHWDEKMKAIRAYKTQFFDPASKEPETFISKPSFLKALEARAIELGQGIGVQYGEGFTSRRWLGVRSLFDLV